MAMTMAKYTVRVRWMVEGVIEVDAPDADAAREAAIDEGLPDITEHEPDDGSSTEFVVIARNGVACEDDGEEYDLGDEDAGVER